jgi:hypothetical protein
MTDDQKGRRYQKSDRHADTLKLTEKVLSNASFYRSIQNIPDAEIAFFKSTVGPDVPPDNPFAQFTVLDEPYCYIVPDYVMRKSLAFNRWNNPLCGWCKIKEEKLRFYRCSKCLLEAYCSGKCQKADWPRHKHRCCNTKLHFDPKDPYAPVFMKLSDKQKGQIEEAKEKGTQVQLQFEEYSKVVREPDGRA